MAITPYANEMIEIEKILEWLMALELHYKLSAKQVISLEILNFFVKLILQCIPVSMVSKARTRVSTTLISLINEYIKWLDEERWDVLCTETSENIGFLSCFFDIGWTTHPLSIRPSIDAEWFHYRKSRYSLSALVANDFHSKVIAILIGFPSSVHDSRLLPYKNFFRDLDNTHFTVNQHGIGDAAFAAYHRVVLNYKGLVADIPQNKDYDRLHSLL